MLLVRCLRRIVYDNDVSACSCACVPSLTAAYVQMSADMKTREKATLENGVYLAPPASPKQWLDFRLNPVRISAITRAPAAPSADTTAKVNELMHRSCGRALNRYRAQSLEWPRRADAKKPGPYPSNTRTVSRNMPPSKSLRGEKVKIREKATLENGSFETRLLARLRRRFAPLRGAFGGACGAPGLFVPTRKIRPFFFST